MEHLEMLLNAGIPAIEMYADAMGVTASEVTEAISNGEITASGFITTMNSAMQSGTSAFPSLTGAAKEAGASWSASFDNMRAAIARGVQSIITSVDETQEALGRPTMRDAISQFGGMMEDGLTMIAVAIPPVLTNLDLLAIGVGGVWLAMKGYTVVGMVTTAYKGFNAVLIATKGAMAASQSLVVMDTASHALLTAALTSSAAAENIRAAAKAKGMTIDAAGNLITASGTAATTAETAAVLASSGALTAKTVVVGLLSGGISIATAAQWAWNAAMLANPIGLLVALIVGAVAAVAALAVALYKAVTKETEAYTEQKKAVEDLTTAQEDLVSSQESSRKSYENSAKSIRQEGDAARSVARELEALRSQETRSASDKARMAVLVEQLNTSLEGLNLSYDEENDLLNLNADQIEEYISAKQTMDESNALLERQNQLYQEEAAVRQNILDLDAKQAELDQQLEDKVIRQGEYNELMEELNASRNAYAEQEQAIADQKAELSAQIVEMDTASAEQVIANAEAVAAAQEEEMQRRVDALNAYTEAATNMFDRINTESELSVNEMIANLEHNQEAVAQWAENLAALGERGLDQGLLQQLRDAGPETAGTVAALVSASDEQLQRLSEIFANGGNVAARALMTELGLPEVTDSATQMVDTMAGNVDQNPALENATIKIIQDAKTAASRQVTASNFSTIGTQMVNGIIAGVNAGASALATAMGNAAAAAYQAAKSRLQINSPSRLFEEMIGLMTMRGWTRGVQKGTPPLLAQMHQAVKAFVAEGTGALSWPDRAAAALSTMQAGVFMGQARFAYASGAAGTGGSVYNSYTQNIYFEDTMQAPDEIARELRIQNTYGMAGER